MNLRYFEADELTRREAEAARAWIRRLKDVCSHLDLKVIDSPVTAMAENAKRAIWLGDPFVIAGNHRGIRQLLDASDLDSVRILRDCAYCWFLTDLDSFNHEQLPERRHVIVSWNDDAHVVIRDALMRLQSHPLLKGLSISSDRLRREIDRIAQGPTGPTYSVLILGPSGAGKEVVFESLVAASCRRHKPKRPISGAWLNMEPGMAMTELVGLRRGRMDERCDGLLKQFSDGSIFIDDFESAPQYIQETLLRVMTDSKGEYRSVGAKVPEYTNVWLLFATNKQLHEFLGKGLREDFLYRFEARIISVPPLKDRPADFPAVAQTVWEPLWAAGGTSNDETGNNNLKEPLRSDALRRLFNKGFDWHGNVRTLRAFLALVVSMMHDPSYNGFSQGELVDVIAARGSSLPEWLGVVQEKTLPRPQNLVERIRDADRGHNREMGPSSRRDPDEKDLAPSEVQARAALTGKGWTGFRRVCRAAPATASRKRVRVSVRLARLVWYVSQSASITPQVAQMLTVVRDHTARQDLVSLSKGSSPLIRATADSRWLAYEKNPAFFRVRS